MAALVSTEDCLHHDTMERDEETICIDCGYIIQNIDNDKEWRYYGDSDSRTSKDPARCHKRKDDCKNILKDIKYYHKAENIPKAIINNANVKYRIISERETKRGTNKMSRIAACIFYSYIEQKEFVTSTEIGDMFNLKRGDMSSGIKNYLEVFKHARLIEIKPDMLIRRILTILDISMEHHSRIMNICKFIEGKSDIIERSNPQSVAASVIYLYISHECITKERKLNKSNFAKLVNLSDITIGKLVKNLQETIQNNNTTLSDIINSN